MTDNPLSRPFRRELALLLVLTPLFLIFMPHNLYVFGSAALGFLVYILIDARLTQPIIWRHHELPEHALAKSLRAVTLLTVPGLLLMLGLALYLGHDIHNRHFLPALGFYLLWALVQQTLFQVYLLGRLRVVLPGASDRLLAILTGTAYALVHLPQLWVTLATIPLGIVWAMIFVRYRQVWPLALSHALLATAFYFWILERDLVAELGL